MPISIRIVHLDHYLAKPGPLDRAFSPFSDRKLAKVPVLRIFGSTKAGQNVCLHVHQIFPYFFVPYTIPAECTTEKDIQKDIFQFGTSLNEAMNLARPNAEKDQHIAAIVLTKGIPFYGYHVGYQAYLKIYMTNSYEKQHMLDILQTSAIGNTSYQPHEAHLNFELQFLIDHNLYGMDWIHIDEKHGLDSSSASFGIRFRLPLLDEPKASYPISQSSLSSSYSSYSHISSQSLDPVLPIYTSKTVPAQLQSDVIPRESYCELEMDITGMSILNRHDIQERNIHTSLKKEKDLQASALYSDEEKVEKLVKSLDSIWKDEASRRRSRGIKEPIPPVSQVDERLPSVPWSAEPALRRSIEKMMMHKPFDENSETQDPSILMPEVMTVFQAVEALYPEEYFDYTQEKQQQQEEKLKSSINQTSLEKEEEPMMRVSSSPRTSSFSPILPPSGTPVSNQFNVSATPSRYRVWNLSSQLDKSVIHTVMESASFLQEQEPYYDDIISGNKDEHTKEEQEDIDDENGFDLENCLRNSDLVQWLEKSERDATAAAQRPSTQIIEYESPGSTYKPRKLDFIAESKKMDTILQTQSNKLKKDILNFSEETDEEGEYKQQSFHISDVPPESMPHVFRRLQRAKRIDQLDGTNDQLDKDTKKRQISSEERWEQEKKTLKRLRMKKSVAKRLRGEQRTLSAPPNTTNMDVVESVDLRRVKSSTSLNPEEMKGAQRVTVRIPRYVPNKRKSNTNGSNTTKRKEFSLGPKPAIEPRPLDKLCSSPLDKSCSSSSQPVNPAASEAINTCSSMDGIDNETDRLREFEDLETETVRSSSLEKESDNVIFHSHPIAVSLQTSVENIPQTGSICTSISKAQIIDQIDTKDQLRTYSISQIENFNADPSEEKAPSSDINAQTPRLYKHESSHDQPLVNKLQVAGEHVSNDRYPSWLYDPAHFEDTQSPIKLDDHHHHTSSSNTSVAKILIYNHVPPVISKEDLPPEDVVYQEPYYSKPSDLPRYPTVFFGKEFKLPTNSLTYLKKFKSSFDIQTCDTQLKSKTRINVWTPTEAPPSVTDVKKWLHNMGSIKRSNPLRETRTQLSEPTALDTFNFKSSSSKPRNKVKRVRDYIEYFSLEVHVNTRDQLLPDPQHDAVQLIFWCLQTEDCRIPSNGYQEGYYVGVIAIEEFDISKIGLTSNQINTDYAQNEEQMFSILIEKIRYYDPDMLVGYEIQNASWGYIIDRGVQLGFHMLDELSRVIVTSETIKRDQWGYQKASVYRVIGRHMLNVWRLMKSELTLTNYTFENIAYHLLHDRVPHYSCATLTSWYQKGPSILKYRLFKYYMKRAQFNLDMLHVSQVVSRTCESARVYGIDFYAVISRGSQYNVESVMFRIAKPENYVLITPNRQQVASQRSLEILPLIMEPISQFYSSPMVVLDFQSLYPSIMVAYNYCYSTCLGRVRKPGESSRFGVQSSFELDDGQLDALKDHINVSPNGVMFVKPEIRKSLLAEMLTELLDTRVMIKRAMKDYKEDSGLLRMLDAKQLTLKLLANVTYGYTSASFSGRMPSVEIADSIVSTGRETLERAIRLINDTEQWGARVVYGDTDSVFIYFPGKTREEAFTLANEIAETVTKMNPKPVKLKFEKVYHPAVLLAKKRYVGFKYENRNETEPVFEAKGIETVRRDGTPATQKILESCLKILFRTQDMSELKEFLYRQWTRILSNRVLLQDFVIAKEVRMGTYSNRGGPNGAQVAQAQMNVDARAEPQYGERVPYVVIYRGPNARLKDKVVRPETLLGDSSLRLDAEYYIRKQIIPPLSRIFNLMGVDILSWYESMPRSQKVAAMNLAQNTGHQAKNLTRIDQYYASSHCILCRKLCDHSLCEPCRQKVGQTIFSLISRQQLTQQRFRKILQICQDCSSLSPLDAMSVVSNTELIADIPCDSLDCPVFYERLKAKQDVSVASSYNSLIDGLSDSSFQL